MKKMSYVLIAVSALVIGAMAVSWAQMTSSPPATTTTTVTTAPVASAPTTAPTAPQAPAAPVAAVQAPTAPAVTPPAAVVPTVPAAPAAVATTPVAAPAVAAPQSTSVDVPDRTRAVETTSAVGTGIGQVMAVPEKKNTGAPDDLRNAISSGEFLKELSFPLTEQQMVEFARASIKVGKINSKWDVQIASAESDTMAIEYNNLAVEEIEFSLRNIPGLTLAQYNELTRMTGASKEFNSVYLAYKQLVLQGAFGAAPKIEAPMLSGVAAPNATESKVLKYGTAVAPIVPKTDPDKAIKNSGAALPDAQPTPTNPVTP